MRKGDRVSCSFENGQAVLDKVREKGFSNDSMNQSYVLKCECGEEVVMDTFEKSCPSCVGVFVVTPCSQDSIENVVFIK